MKLLIWLILFLTTDYGAFACRPIGPKLKEVAVSKTSASVSLNDKPERCSIDENCSIGQFCFRRTFNNDSWICTSCISCMKYKRAPPKTGNCARSKSECGNCEKGYELFGGTCLWATEIPETTIHNKTVNQRFSSSRGLLVVIPILCLFAIGIWYFSFCILRMYSSFESDSDPESTDSITTKTTLLTPSAPPYINEEKEEYNCQPHYSYKTLIQQQNTIPMSPRAYYVCPAQMPVPFQMGNGGRAFMVINEQEYDNDPIQNGEEEIDADAAPGPNQPQVFNEPQNPALPAAPEDLDLPMDQVLREIAVPDAAVPVIPDINDPQEIDQVFQGENNLPPISNYNNRVPNLGATPAWLDKSCTDLTMLEENANMEYQEDGVSQAERVVPLEESIVIPEEPESEDEDE